VTAPRFHVPGAASNRVVSLPPEVAHHALGVLRLRAGAHLRVFDGEGHEFDAWLESLASVRVGDSVPSRPESPLRILLALPPLKGDRMELVIQKATELGVAEIWPTLTARTDAAGRPALFGARRERWARVASAAAEQSGRAVVPTIAEARDLTGLLAHAWTASRRVARLAFLDGAEAQRIARGLGSDAHPEGVVALIGPPGGFDESEMEAIGAGGFQKLSLGPRTLRSETAAIVAVSLLQHLWGDLGGPDLTPATGATEQP